MTAKRLLATGMGLLLLLATAAEARPMTDAEIRQEIIRESIAANGGVCVCPWQKDRKGKICGSRSLYNQPGGVPPQCYPEDIDETGIEAWLNEKHATRR